MEGGGARLSTINGIGSAQQLPEATEMSAPASSSRALRPDSRTAANAFESSTAAAADQTQWSAASGVMAQALAGSDVRSDKVAALQQAIAAGTYNVPAADVAAKVMGSLMD